MVYAAVFGKYGAASPERGVYKSTDGGDSWTKILFRNDSTGAIDIAIDRTRPDVLYASLWQAYRNEYTMSSGGAGSGLFKSTDGGAHWTEITRNPGLPQQGLDGKIGVTVSRANPDRLYALVENDEGGLFRSDDAGATWERVNDDRRIRQRAFYYTHVFADPKDPDVVYMENTSLYRSKDGGKTLQRLGGTHGDFHDLWIDPDDPTHMVVGNDGGGAVSVDTGKTWTEQDFPTGQFYHVATTAHIPYHVCGAQQDNSTLCVPSDVNAERFRSGGTGRGGDDDGASPGVADLTAGTMASAYPVGGGEPGYIAPDPENLSLFYSGANNGRYVDKYNRVLGTSREVDPYPWFYSGEPSESMVERWQWTFPILFSPLDPHTLYVASQRLWKTTDGGRSWQALSGDLTRHDPKTLGPSGGPITHDMNGPEVYATVFAVGPGKVDQNVIWTGSDDGLVYVTRDGGKHWTNVTPPGMPDFGRVSQIDASSWDAGRAYVAVKRPLLEDQAPYAFKTDDYGRTWTKIVRGIRPDAYVHAVREDPTRKGLLYAATQHGVYISWDDGGLWQPLDPGLPDVPVVDLVVEDNSLAIATHGRGFWILDDLAPLRQATSTTTSRDMVLFDPPVAYRSGDGVTLSYWLGQAPSAAKLEIVDGTGQVLRTFEPADTAVERDRWQGPALPVEKGLNELHWDLTTQPWTSFPGMILWGVRDAAPAVPPGTYTVRLTADGTTESTRVEVRRNPWIPDVSDADLQAQYAFGRKVWEQVDKANRAVVAIRRVKAQIDDRLEKSDDARLKAAADKLTTDASAVEGDIYQVKNRSNQDPLNFPIRVNNRLANLLSMSERGDGPPREGMRDVFRIMSDRLQGYTQRLDQVWATDLAEVNRQLERLGLPRVDPDAKTKLVSERE